MTCWLFGHADAIRDVVGETKVWRCSRCWATWPREQVADPLPAARPGVARVQSASERVRERLAREAEVGDVLTWRRTRAR